VEVGLPANVWSILAAAAQYSDFLPDDDDRPIMSPEEDAIVCAFAKQAWAELVHDN
jgi:hypothetical protein